MAETPLLRSAKTRWGYVGLLLLVIALLALPPLPYPGGSAGWSAAPLAVVHPSFAPRSVAPVVHRAASPLFLDWDPLGTVSIPGLAASDFGGVGAGFGVSDRYGTGVLFGGVTSAGLGATTATINQTTANWSALAPVISPSPRAYFGMAAADPAGLAVLFGGLVDRMSGACTNDTWVFWFRNGSWENVTHGVAPPARESAAFAVDGVNRTALLEGGVNPDFVSGGGTGTVTWNDTWSLNLTTFNWTRIPTPLAPPPLSGSKMAWAPNVHRFVMYGGCYGVCSSTVWTFASGAGGGSGNWTVPTVHGTVTPGARAGATFVYAPNFTSVVLFGGESLLNGVWVPLNTTYLYDPFASSWSPFVGIPQPSPRADAPGAWMAANGCPGLVMVGGLPKPQAPDEWMLDLNPDLGTNCLVWETNYTNRRANGTGNDSGGNGGPCAAQGNLSVLVTNSVGGRPLRNVTVVLQGKCGPRINYTNSTGWVNFSRVFAVTTTINAYLTDFHTNQTRLNVSRNVTTVVWFNLTHLPSLVLRTFGVNRTDPRYSLGNVTIFQSGSLAPWNFTSPTGWINMSAYPGPMGPVTFLAERANYSEASNRTTVPYTGIFRANLTLLSYGNFTVRVAELGTNESIPLASGVIEPMDAGSAVEPRLFTTDAFGTYTALLPQGNYTVQGWRSGFEPNATARSIFHPWINTTFVVLTLRLLESFSLHVRLLDAHSHLPIGGGGVELGYTYPLTTSGSGWANFSGIRIPGSYAVLGQASGYFENRTVVEFDYYLPILQTIEMNLTPAGCLDCARVGTNGTGPFQLLPANGYVLGLMLAAPLLLVFAAVGYVVGVRRRPEGPR